jgi:hypothetical protein
MKTQLTDLNPTTRCFPREMRTAFPFDQQVIEHYKRPSNKNYVVRTLAILGIIAVLIAIKVM